MLQGADMFADLDSSMEDLYSIQYAMEYCINTYSMFCVTTFKILAFTMQILMVLCHSQWQSHDAQSAQRLRSCFVPVNVPTHHISVILMPYLWMLWSQQHAVKYDIDICHKINSLILLCMLYCNRICPEPRWSHWNYPLYLWMYVQYVMYLLYFMPSRAGVQGDAVPRRGCRGQSPQQRKKDQKPIGITIRSAAYLFLWTGVYTKEYTSRNVSMRQTHTILALTTHHALYILSNHSKYIINRKNRT